MEQTLLCIAFPAFVFSLVSIIIYAVHDLCLKPKFLRAKLLKQGIAGPKPTLIKELASDAIIHNSNETLSLDCRSVVLPAFHISANGPSNLNMPRVVLESGNTLVKSLESLVESEGGIADVRVDDYVKTFTDLMEVSGSPTVLVDGRPFYRYFPTKMHRQQWRLEKEIYRIIQNLEMKCKSEGEGEGIIHTLVDSAKHGELESSTPQQFIVDNCKELCIVAMEVPGISAIWGLMLLALHPEWQERARAEQETKTQEIISGRKLLKWVAAVGLKWV
ncbi:cytochrome P450 714B2 [Daucus carota subsp. sativus]|uniref:cytochrome P450 714B2 n=1 Tax=Daucus carota subsp. sativus TaxID=79200 RepID=UPI0007EFB2A4|nr:PREDICTED: cytochrome P450 714B2-like [Daucus carota subsp. sativus]